jgi:hypothetical protein
MKVGRNTTEIVYEFVYLGTHVTKQRDELKDIIKWAGLVKNTYFSLLPISQSREVHRQTKAELYKTLIRSILW